MTPPSSASAALLDFPPDPATGKVSPADSRSTGFYSPALDGLRCVAVVGVFLNHFSPTLNQFAEWGQWGVRLFFVLSGFLITRLLLEARIKIESGRLTVGSGLRAFFIRRIFRLWPVYFFALAVACAFNVAPTRETIWWHVFMATNQYVFHVQGWPGMLSHFWTLAVEQQFYLFWPFVIFFTPKRWLNPVLLTVMLAGPMSRELIIALRCSYLGFVYLPLPCCLDFFAIGGAVAWGHHSGWLDRIATLLRLRLLLVPAVAWLVYGAVLKSTGGVFPACWVVFDPLIQAAGFAVLIVYMLRKPDGFTARCLSRPTLVYLGGISYGIYIYHNFMHWFGPSFLRHTTGYTHMLNEPLRFIYYSVLAVAIAAASHRFLEEPLRRWGRRFG